MSATFHDAAHDFDTDKGPRRHTADPKYRGGFNGHGYTLVYEREFPGAFGSPTLESFPCLLEIGVQMGCSLRLWDWWFSRSAHPDWLSVGVDISLVQGLRPLLDANLNFPDRTEIVQADSTDPDSVDKVLKAFDGSFAPGRLFDVVIDDGSHVPDHQLKTLKNFWPLVRPGGIYCIEDLHQSYWPPEFMQGSIMPTLGQFVEDVVGRGKYAAWSGVDPVNPNPLPQEESFFSARFYRNMVVLEKRAKP